MGEIPKGWTRGYDTHLLIANYNYNLTAHHNVIPNRQFVIKYFQYFNTECSFLSRTFSSFKIFSKQDKRKSYDAIPMQFLSSES